MLDEMSREYQFVDGADLSTRLAGQTVPIPPQWVIDRSPVPPRLKKISWHKDLRGWPEPRFREGCVDYVKAWPENFHRGENLVIASRIASMKKSYAAAATLHEIIRNYAPVQDFNSVWLSIQRDLPWMLRARATDKLTFESLWQKLNTAKLVVLDDILRIQEMRENRWFLESVFSRRVYDSLPTIVTLAADVSEDWKEITPIVGKSMASLLHETTRQKALA